MSTAKSLTKPQIVEIKNSTIRVKHPDISGYRKSFLTAPFTAAATALTVGDNDGFADDDWFILGEIGDAKTEECDVNGAVTRGTSLTITNTTKFSHEIHTPVTRILERKIKIYGAATDGGTGTVIASTTSGVNIQWDKPYTEINLITTDTAYAYYYATFYDGTTESSASDYVVAAGLGYTTAGEMITSGLNEVNAEIDGQLITREWLLTLANDFQDEVKHYATANGLSKDWSFELVKNDTSIATTENENEYALSGLTYALKYPNSKQGILNVKLGTKVLDPKDVSTFDDDMEDCIKTYVASAASAGDTTLTLDDTYEFAESGTVYVGGDAVTYTANAEATGVLSGIPASGTGAITETHAVDASVWQNISPGLPKNYTIFNGKILLDRPVDEDYAGQKLKFRYLKALTRFDSWSDTTEITFPHLAKYYIGSRIEARKGNLEQSNYLLGIFNQKLEMEAMKDGLPTLQSQSYYDIDYDPVPYSNRNIIEND
jgi:hypothetical protein